MNKKTDDQIWQEPYRHSDFMEDFLENMTRGKKTLNLCSGKSLIGDVRIDVDKRLKEPTAYCDMFDSLLTFHKNGIKFKVVYVDPPFERDGVNFYNPRSAYIVNKAKKLGYKDHFGRLAYDWQKMAFDICELCLITRRDRSNVNLPSLLTEYYKVWDSRPSTHDFRIDWKAHPY